MLNCGRLYLHIYSLAQGISHILSSATPSETSFKYYQRFLVCKKKKILNYNVISNQMSLLFFFFFFVGWGGGGGVGWEGGGGNIVIRNCRIAMRKTCKHIHHHVNIPI